MQVKLNILEESTLATLPVPFAVDRPLGESRSVFSWPRTEEDHVATTNTEKYGSRVLYSIRLDTFK